MRNVKFDILLEDMNYRSRLRNVLPHGFPLVTTLCGSTRFPKDFEEANRNLTLQGRIVISVGLYGHQEAMDMGGYVKKDLDRLHFRKIDLSDSIFVVNPMHPICEDGPLEPYLGQSTRNEIRYATDAGKAIEFLNYPTLGQWLDVRPRAAYPLLYQETIRTELVNGVLLTVQQQIFMEDSSFLFAWCRNPFYRPVVDGVLNPVFTARSSSLHGTAVCEALQEVSREFHTYHSRFRPNQEQA